MNKDLLALMGISVFTAFTMNYFFRSSTPPVAAVVAGQGYRLPSSEELARPVERQVRLAAGAEAASAQASVVKTPRAEYTFSTIGGSITQVRLPQYKNGQHEAAGMLADIETKPQHELFFLALDDASPVLYKKYSEERIDGGAVRVIYVAYTDEWEIHKAFVVKDFSYELDLSITFKPRVSHPKLLRPRLLVPAPALEDVPRNRVVPLVSKTGNVGIVEATGDQVNEQAWVAPVYFGAADLHSAHVMTKDADAFVQRGFFVVEKLGSAPIAALEGPAIATTSTFNLSFYVGPRLYREMMMVDPHLQEVLFTGWFSSLTRWLLEALQMVVDYTGNWGWAILLFVFLFKLLTLPFMIISMRKMAIHQRLDGQVRQIRRQYANDIERANSELMALYQQHGTSPLGVSWGCMVPLLGFGPFFLFSRLFYGATEFYQTPFFGWITDLSVRDPYYLLAAIAAVFIYNQPPLPMQNSKSRAMSYIFPLLMIGFVVSSSAAMQLYFCVTMGFAFIENKFRVKA